MKTINAIKITCEILNELSPDFIKSLSAIGIDKYNVKPGRSVSLYESENSIFKDFKKIKLEENPTDIYDFLVKPADEISTMKYIISEMELDIPGRGSIYSTKVQVITDDETDLINRINVRYIPQITLLTKLVGIRCIVQNGKATGLVKAALQMGVSVPVITLGQGAGLRDRLGLLRITIPAEKEIVNFLVHEGDADKIIEVITQASKIYDLGNGYIYTYPINNAMVNTRIYRGKEKYVASMDQIISLLDQMNGGADWRQRFSKNEKQHTISSKIKTETDLIDINMSCNEGTTLNLIQHTLLQLGSGATISRYRMHFPTKPNNISPIREGSYMTINQTLQSQLLEIVKQHNEAKNGTTIEISKVIEAYSYKR